MKIIRYKYQVVTVKMIWMLIESKTGLGRALGTMGTMGIRGICREIIYLGD